MFPPNTTKLQTGKEMFGIYSQTYKHSQHLIPQTAQTQQVSYTYHTQKKKEKKCKNQIKSDMQNILEVLHAQFHFINCTEDKGKKS